MQQTLSFSVLGAVIGEMLGGNDGWGVQISRYQAMFDSAAVIGLVVLTSLFAVMLNAVMMFFEAQLFKGRN